MSLSKYDVYRYAIHMRLRIERMVDHKLTIRKLERSLHLTATQIEKIASYYDKTFELETHGSYTYVRLK